MPREYSLEIDTPLDLAFAEQGRTKRADSPPKCISTCGEAEFLSLKHKSRILGHSSNPVCAFSMMEQVRLFAVWPTENWLGYSLNQIQGWPTVRESYSRALKQRPLRGSQQVYSGFHPLVSNVLLLLFAKVARACLGSRQLQYQPTSWWKFQLVEASAAHLACYSISSVTFCLLTRY